jgi:CheY-like chemotaxis protein
MDKDPIHVLVADDNDDDVILIREALETQGIRVVAVARDGEEALSYLRRHEISSRVPRPALMLLDINMPLKNGFEVLGELKADPALALLPVVILTTSQREEDVARSYAEGATSFITKPARSEELHELARLFSLYWRRVSRLPAA